MGYVAYRLKLPLTIRSSLMPLFGDRLNGPFGHLGDIIAVVATVPGIATTVGTGVLQLISGFESLSGATWLWTRPAMLFALVLVLELSTISALTGVGKGVKWLGNINLTLSFVLLAVFLVFGSVGFAISTYFSGLTDYLPTCRR